jgi:hypothetical protein
MNSQAQRTGLFNRFDLLVMLGAIVTLFVALGNEPWWSLNGATINNLFSIEVSPFFVHISAIGLPATVPLGNALGIFTRTFLLLGFLSLFAASIRPTAWWRNLAVYFGLSSLAELYLSFLLMFYWAETAFVNTYGTLPPFYGTTNLPVNILGLNLAYYTAPLVTAVFNIPFYIGFVSIGLLLGRSLVKILHERAFQVLAALLPGGGIHDIYLSPPYQNIWFSSGDKQYNPMQTDPDGLADDELLVSFEKLYQTVEPGGSLSIILPDSAAGLGERLEKLMPQTGFVVEKTGVIYRTEGKAETEMRFRRPTVEKALAPEPTGTLEILEEPEEVPAIPPIPTILPAPKTAPAQPETPPMREAHAEAPIWVDKRMTRLERTMLKSAVRNITERRQPVPYRELLNQVYMDLVDHKVEFDSARQIETSLLDHNGRELLVLEETDDAGSHKVKKWWLGDQKMGPDQSHGIRGLTWMNSVKPKLPSLRRVFKNPRKARYKSKTSDDEQSEESAVT